MEEKESEISRLAEVGLMTPSIIHDIRGYLAVIKAYAQLGLKDFDHERMLSRFGKIVQTVNSIEELIEIFRSFYIKGEVVKREVKISEITEEALSVNSPRLGAVTLVKDIEDFSLQANKILLRQAIANLISNALDAVENSQEKIIGIKTRKKTNEGFIWIFDSGDGIPPEIEEKIFSPFFTTKEKGTGLGLHIAKKVIDAHGGEIKICKDFQENFPKINSKNSNIIKTAFEIKLPLRR